MPATTAGSPPHARAEAVPGRRLGRITVNVLMVAGAALVASSGAIHLHLWQQGYRYIATIGPLFLAQAVSGFVLGAAIAVLRRVPLALLGAAFLLATIGGFLISVNNGLFGFRDTTGAPWAVASLWVEGGGAVVLLVAASWRHLLVHHAKG